jgi:hypothetical protein
MFHQSYLYRLFRNSPALACCLVVGLLAQLFFTVRRTQCLPIFHYGMYADDVSKADRISLIEIYDASGHRIAKEHWNAVKQELLEAQINLYAAVSDNNGLDPMEQVARQHIPTQYQDAVIQKISNSPKVIMASEWVAQAVQRHEGRRIPKIIVCRQQVQLFPQTSILSSDTIMILRNAAH